MKKDTFFRFYRTYKLYIFPLAVILSSLFLILFIIYPQTMKLISGRVLKEEIINKSKFLETKAEALRSYEESDLSRKVKLALTVYPGGRDFGYILGLLQELSAKSGFSVNSISFGPQTGTTGKAQNYTIALDLQGSKLLIPTLLASIENAPRLIRVTKMDISSAGASQTSDISLALEVLYAEPPKTYGAADTPLPQLTDKDLVLLSALETIAPSVSVPSTPSGPATPYVPSTPRGKVNPFE